MKKLFSLALLSLPITSFAVDGVLDNGNVTKVRAYETSGESTTVYLGINGQSRVGPNPDSPSVNCELWTYSKEVFSVALAAQSSGQKVNVRYVARGDGDAFCKVRYLEVVN